MKKFLYVIVLLAFVFGIIAPNAFATVNETGNLPTPKVIPKPAILIHGLVGNSDTFKTMKASYEQNFDAVGEVRVDKKGNLTMEKSPVVMTNITYGPGSEDGTVTRTPLVINMVMENNTASIEDQAKWLKKVVDETKKHYGTPKVDIIAHSMGGLAATKYILDSDGKDVDTLITLDSPILGSDAAYYLKSLIQLPSKILKFPTLNDYILHTYGRAIIDLSPTSKAIKDLTSSTNREKFRKIARDNHIRIISWAATEWEGKGTFNLVSTESAHGLKYFTDQITLMTKKTDHSGMHEMAADISLAYTNDFNIGTKVVANPFASWVGKWKFDNTRGVGYLEIKNVTSKTIEFDHATASKGNNHIGGMEGKATIQGNKAIFDSGEKDQWSDNKCIVTLTADKDKITVEAPDCSTYHGLNGFLGGTFTKAGKVVPKIDVKTAEKLVRKDYTVSVAYALETKYDLLSNSYDIEVVDTKNHQIHYSRYTVNANTGDLRKWYDKLDPNIP